MQEKGYNIVEYKPQEKHKWQKDIELLVTNR